MIIKTIAEIGKYSESYQAHNKEGNDFLIFPATLGLVSISKNHVQYTEKALVPLASPYKRDHTGGYEGAPVFINHDITNVESVIGKVHDVSYEEGKLRGNLHLFKDSNITSRVKAGLIKNVSFHNTVTNVSCSVCGKDYGKECTEHKLGETYDEKVCAMLPHNLGAVEVSLVAFGGIEGARIGETLEGFDERIDCIQKDEDSEEVIEDIIPDDTSEDNNTLNKTFINEKEEELIKESFKENEADIMSENKDMELQFKQEVEKLKLEKQTLEEKVSQFEEELEAFKETERQRLEKAKELLIEEINAYSELDEEKRKSYMLFEIDALQEFAEIIKQSSKKSSEEEPMHKAKVTTVGEKKDPREEQVRQFLEKQFR